MAGVLERRVWVQALAARRYPNLYVLLVGRPGTGKTEVTDRIRLLWTGLDAMHVSSASLTRAAFADELNEAKVILPGNEYNALHGCINEFGTLFPKYDPEFMAHLTDVWDCKVYTERKRGSKLQIVIENPYFNMLAGTQPGFLQQLLPDMAWEQGLMSRVVMVYGVQQEVGELFDIPVINLSALKKDLLRMRDMHGAFTLTDAAKNRINEWNKAGGPPRPRHPKLQNYNTRRTSNVIKLMQVASASSSDNMVIDDEHVLRAIDWLIATEAEMENVFKTMTSGGDSSIISEAMHFLTIAYIKGNKTPVARTRLTAFLMEKTDAYKVRHILELMESSGMMELKAVDGRSAYVPRAKGMAQ